MQHVIVTRLTCVVQGGKATGTPALADLVNRLSISLAGRQTSEIACHTSDPDHL